MDTDSLAGLLFSCPFNKSLGNCVFNKIRKLNITDRTTLYLTMDKATKESFIRKHKNCLNLREGKQVSPAKESGSE